MTLRVDVHAYGTLRPQAQGGDGQNAAAAAQIQAVPAGLHLLLHGLHDHLGGGVSAGAEGQTRVEDDLLPTRFLLRQPVGEDYQIFAHLLGRIAVLPAFLPVGLRQGLCFHGKSQFGNRVPKPGKAGLVAFLQVQLDSA